MKKNNSVNSKFDWEKFKEKLEYVKSSVDPRYLVENLGFHISRETPKELRASCLIHGGDNKTAFRFNKEKRSWVCFTHKCHEIFGTDIIGLIKATKNCEFRDAVEYLMSLCGDTVAGETEILNYKIKKERDDFLKDYKKKPVNSSIVNEECLKQFKPFRSKSFIDDGFKKETLDFFEIAGGYTDSFGYIRDIIPLRNEEGKLMSYSMRDVRRDVEDDDFKYILTKNFNKDILLYNLNNAKKYIEELPLIIVEGFKSVWRLYEYGIYNVVAVMGSEITSGQLNLLYQYTNNNGIVIIFDNDEPGVIGMLKAYETIKHKLDSSIVFITEVDSKGKGLDPSDLDKETIENYLHGYI